MASRLTQSPLADNTRSTLTGLRDVSKGVFLERWQVVVFSSHPILRVGCGRTGGLCIAKSGIHSCCVPGSRNIDLVRRDFRNINHGHPRNFRVPHLVARRARPGAPTGPPAWTASAFLQDREALRTATCEYRTAIKCEKGEGVSGIYCHSPRYQPIQQTQLATITHPRPLTVAKGLRLRSRQFRHSCTPFCT